MRGVSGLPAGGRARGPFGDREEAVGPVVVAVQPPAGALQQPPEVGVGERVVLAQAAALPGGQRGPPAGMEQGEPAARAGDAGKLGQAAVGVGEVRQQPGGEAASTPPSRSGRRRASASISHP